MFSNSKIIFWIILFIVIRLSGVGSWGQQIKQGAPDFPFPGHIDQLWWGGGDPEELLNNHDFNFDQKLLGLGFFLFIHRAALADNILWKNAAGSECTGQRHQKIYKCGYNSRSVVWEGVGSHSPGSPPHRTPSPLRSRRPSRAACDLRKHRKQTIRQHTICNHTLYRSEEAHKPPTSWRSCKWINTFFNTYKNSLQSILARPSRKSNWPVHTLCLGRGINTSDVIPPVASRSTRHTNQPSSPPVAWRPGFITLIQSTTGSAHLDVVEPGAPAWLDPVTGHRYSLKPVWSHGQTLAQAQRREMLPFCFFWCSVTAGTLPFWRLNG